MAALFVLPFHGGKLTRDSVRVVICSKSTIKPLNSICDFMVASSREILRATWCILRSTAARSYFTVMVPLVSFSKRFSAFSHC